MIYIKKYAKITLKVKIRLYRKQKGLHFVLTKT